MKYLEENVRREMEEESAIHSVHNLRFTGLVFQDTEKTYPPNWAFQYVIFQAFVDQKEIDSAWDHFEWIKEHPKGFARFKRDRREKDAITWYNPRTTKLYGSWAPGIVKMYLEANRS